MIATISKLHDGPSTGDRPRHSQPLTQLTPRLAISRMMFAAAPCRKENAGSGEACQLSRSNESIRARAIKTTQRLIAMRCFFFYAFDARVLSLVGIGFALPYAFPSRGQWLGSAGNEWFLAPFWIAERYFGVAVVDNFD